LPRCAHQHQLGSRVHIYHYLPLRSAFLKTSSCGILLSILNMVKTYHGECYCRAVKWQFTLDSPEDGRTSLCHCMNCKVCPKLIILYISLPLTLTLYYKTQKWFGSNYGMLIKVPWDRFRWEEGSAQPQTHESDNKGKKLTRQFCGGCGSGVRDFSDAAEGKFTYVCYGGMDEDARRELVPKAEFFISKREPWCQNVKGDGALTFYLSDHCSVF